jgi:hypothetical protein
MEWPEHPRNAVWADTGTPVAPLTGHDASRLAAAFGKAPASAATLIERDQWTVAQGFDPHRPLWRVNLADADGTQIYIAARTGEVVQQTIMCERGWNWLGAIPHWLYLTSIRTHPEFWRQLVMWTSGPALVVGVTGLWIGIVRLSRRGRWATPYRGWMKWHHVLGLTGGLTLVTWMFSGWLSVSPFGWFARGGNPAVAAAWQQPPDAAVFPALDIQRLSRGFPDAREVRLDHLAGNPVIRMWPGAGNAGRALLTADGQTIALSGYDLEVQARTAMDGAPLVSSEQLTRPDVHWYGRWQNRPLPVWRLRFADSTQTWLHVDAITGELLSQSTASSRTYRWLFNLLHDFDLPWLLDNRTVRDPLLWLLLALGTAISISGIVIGWRRLAGKPARSLQRSLALRAGTGPGLQGFRP